VRLGICRAGFSIIHKMSLGLMGKDGLRTGRIKIRGRVEPKCLRLLTTIEEGFYWGLK